MPAPHLPGRGYWPELIRLLPAAVAAALLATSCNRTQTVPPATSSPELRIPAAAPAAVSPAPLGVRPVDWKVPPWRLDRPARDWKYIVIHHTATQVGSVESIHRTHLLRTDAGGNPWRGIGYHFVIGNGHGMEDGAVEPTFRWRDQIEGAHAGHPEFNAAGIGICLIGDFEKDRPTQAQLESLLLLVRTLMSDYEIPAENVKRHGDVKATACPGRFFPMRELRESLRLPRGDQTGSGRVTERTIGAS